MFKTIIYLSLLFFSLSFGRTLFKIVEYPNDWSRITYNPVIARTSQNLLPSVILFDNGTMITVGSRIKAIDVQKDDIERAIWMQPLRYSSRKLKDFMNIVRESGFFNISYSYPKPNMICYSAINPIIVSDVTHQACIGKGDSNSVFQKIFQSLEKMFAPVPLVEYFPKSMIVKTINYMKYPVPVKDVVITTKSQIIAEFDPNNRIFFKSTTPYETNVYVYNNTAKTFMISINKHKIYRDNMYTFSFAAYIPELSEMEVIYETETKKDSTLIDNVDNSFNSMFVILSIVFVVIIILIFIFAILIRRCKDSNSKEDYIEDSDEDLSQSVHLSQPGPQTIFVQSGIQPYPMFSDYNPIFVNTPIQNTMIPNSYIQTPMMPHNTFIQNPIMFPQPTVFYPQNQ